MISRSKVRGNDVRVKGERGMMSGSKVRGE